jgi:nucleoside recognition membrane protein YjiH
VKVIKLLISNILSIFNVTNLRTESYNNIQHWLSARLYMVIGVVDMLLTLNNHIYNADFQKY